MKLVVFNPLPLRTQLLFRFLTGADGRTDRMTDRRMDEASFKVACPLLKGPFTSPRQKLSQGASLRALLESAFSGSLQRDVKLLKTLTRTRKERLESVVGRINSEVNFLAKQCQPNLARDLEEILVDVTANLDSSPARKKAFMARVTRINQAFRTKRKNDDAQVCADPPKICF